ncbi:MAG: nuclear transport factor 2 family protein [Thermoleophilaceae bacterium]|nr:nuclear transport factor 2 family protein [Thermoleophilaceae bacterium]
MRTRGFEVVEAWHAAVNAGDAERAVALAERDVDVEGPRGRGYGRELLREWLEGAGIALELRRAFACGQTVVVEQSARWRSAATAELGEEQLVASVFEVRDGCIARIARHSTLESALREGCVGEADAVVAPSGTNGAVAFVRGVHHIALATRDLDRLAAFYTAVFGAGFVDGRPGPGIVTVGNAALHAFEQPEGSLGGTPASAPGEPSSSGRVRHFSLEASDLDGFTAVRERLLARAATYGEVTDFGDHVSLFFGDPDGYFCELTLLKPSAWKPPFETVTHEPRR